MSDKDNQVKISSLITDGHAPSADTRDNDEENRKESNFISKVKNKLIIKNKFFNKWLLISFAFFLLSIFLGLSLNKYPISNFFQNSEGNKKKIYKPIINKDEIENSQANEEDYFSNLLPHPPTKEYPNPTNGVYLTKELYKDVTSRKPIAVMLNNHPLSRPQAGISEAEIIYEVVAEGGVSRLMAIFHTRLPKRVGSVRSARVYYQQLAAEYWPIFVNWGIAHRPDYEKNLSTEEFEELLLKGEAETDPRADARGYIDKIALPTLDQTVIGNGDVFYRDTSLNIPLEHTGFANLQNVYKEFKKWYPEPSWSKYQSFESWVFKDAEDKKESGTPVDTIQYNFWDLPEFETTWEYNSKENAYYRKQGNKQTIDRNTQKTFPIKTLIVLKAKEVKLGDKKAHLLYEVIGSGEANIYIDGTKIQGTWKKDGARKRINFKDSLGNPIALNRGLIWITILPEYQQIVEK